ncbi:hypothetical protein TRM7557_00881 [Tritonibacter multivorans]|uniref:Integral membrane protein n=1 Tax=Tritonibacter multivorans TaxID=928856 RepID=A0A0P1G3Z7_9RHOB|nr:hypothetical protein [Tritonibacter multivorans]MDA7422576.1 hypothetical protein [Tritonibacter multivorans]CUH76402.1 hypothetical protein TRM7557_00881 [Tritonibacter multivorans]SFD38637.1 hypothetical protein SAMN04488049_11246 [Tritonibacter multivorans]
MAYQIFRSIAALPLLVHIGAAIATFVGFNWIKARLDASYAASNHPVDYATGQTTFDGAAIKGFYAHMSDLGTLDVYRTTQLIDFGFILAIACMGLFFCTLVARASRDGSWGRWLGLTAGLCAVMGAICDAIENGWSFVMLADPDGFADWLALPYSGFASLKFAFITAAMGCLLLSLLCAAAGRLSRRVAIG